MNKNAFDPNYTHKSTRLFAWLLICLILACAFSACAASPKSTPMPSALPSAIPTVIPSATLTPLPTHTPRPTPTPTLAPGDKMIRQSDGMTMVYVPAGEYYLGQTGEEKYNNCVKHQYFCARGDPVFSVDTNYTVKLDAFWIDQTEVTYAKYLECVKAGACEVNNSQAQRCLQIKQCTLEGSNQSSVVTTDQNWYIQAVKQDYYEHPVVNITWFDAERYCDWAGARLPTAAEWEAAARGTDRRLYPWGNESPYKTLLNYNHTSDTTVVGSFPSGASPYGAMDMAGNVSEWVSDWYSDEYYILSNNYNPQGPRTGTFKIMMGSSRIDADLDIVVSMFSVHRPQNYDIIFGFRCAMSVP